VHGRRHAEATKLRQRQGAPMCDAVVGGRRFVLFDL
jgi:hypothetical protein